MGYTHYWYRPQHLDADRFLRFSRDVALLTTKLPATRDVEMYHPDESDSWRSSQWDIYAFPVTIAGGFGVGAPEFSAERIWFNGAEQSVGSYTGKTVQYTKEPEVAMPAPSSRVGDMSRETFHIARDMEPDDWQTEHDGLYFECCKTARKPYDILVMAALIALRQNLPECRVESDGGPEDWKDGVAFYETVFPDRPLPLRGPWEPAQEDKN